MDLVYEDHYKPNNQTSNRKHKSSNYLNKKLRLGLTYNNKIKLVWMAYILVVLINTN